MTPLGSTRAWKSSFLFPLFSLFLALTLSACGPSASGSHAVFSPGGPAPQTLARLELNFDLQLPLPQRAVPPAVVEIRISGYNLAGQLVYGPVTRPKATQIVLTDVPVEVTSIRLEYLEAAQKPAGLYAESVELQPGAVTVITDPPYEDFNNPPSLTRIEVAPATATLPVGIQQDFIATAVFNTGFRQVLTEDATWSVADPTFASVGNTAGTRGHVTALAAGTTTVDAAYAGRTGQANLTVTPAQLVSLAVTPATASVAAGRTQQFTATGTFTDNSTQDLTNQVTWSSSNPSVATVENVPARSEDVVAPQGGVTPGRATGVAQGQATITASHAASGKSGSAALSVTPAVLVSLAVTPSNPSVAKGRTQQFTATGTFSNNTTQDLTNSVTWSSSAAGTATVSNTAGTRGLASTHAVGQATITATDPTTSINGNTTLTVTAAQLVSVAVTPTNPSIAKGRTQQFAATGTYTDSTTQDLTATVTWSSGTPATATISNAAGSQGLATSVAVGTTTVTATDPTTSLSGNTTLTVTPAVLVSIAVTPAAPSIAKGRTQAFTATGTFSDSTTQDLTGTVTWSSTATNVATISNAAGSKGVATGAGVGTTTIRATDSTTQIQGSTTLAVTAAELVSLAVTPPSPLVPLGQTQQMTATGTYSDNTTQNLTSTVTWSSLDTNVATVSNAAGSKGLVSTVAIGGPVTLRAIDPTTSIQGDASVEVVAAALVSLAVTPATPSVAKGRTQQFVATGTFSDSSTRDLTDTVNWTSSSTNVATISNGSPGRISDLARLYQRGLATALAVGQTTITATYPSTAISGNTTLTVTAAELVSIAVTPATPSVAKGRTQQFTATGTYSDSSTANLTTSVTWSSSATNIATISNAAGSKGLATAAAVGSTTITATDATTSISNTATMTVTAAELVSLAVTPANPSVVQGGTRQFTATGTYSDSSTQDLTGTVTWSSSATNIATISNAAGSQGLATAAAVGSTTIKAVDPTTSIEGSTGLTVTEPPPPQITVVFKNACGGTDVPPEVNGLTVRWVRQDTFAQVTGTLDAQGKATFTKEQIVPGVAWQAQILSGNGVSGGTSRTGCWDGTHANWGTAASPPTGEPAGEVWLYIKAPGTCVAPPLPPAGSASWGNSTGCTGS